MTLSFLSGSKNLRKLLWVSCEVFVFTRKCSDPLGGQGLHHDCISMIVSRLTTFAEDLVIRCYQVTKDFLHEVRLRQSVFCTVPFVILVLWQILQFRLLGKCVWTLFLHIPSRLLSMGFEEASWEDVACEPPCNGISSSTSNFPEFLQPLRDLRTQRFTLFILGFLFI